MLCLIFAVFPLQAHYINSKKLNGSTSCNAMLIMSLYVLNFVFFTCSIEPSIVLMLTRQHRYTQYETTYKLY